MRSLWSGRSLVLMESGTIFKENLSRASIDLNEFLGQARVAGYFDPNEIQTAILETNGQISFLPKSGSRPVTPQDLQLTPEPVSAWYDLILDGQLMEDNLKAGWKASCTAWASGRKARYFTRAATSRAHSSPAATGKQKGRSPKLRPFCIGRHGPDYLK